MPDRFELPHAVVDLDALVVEGGDGRTSLTAMEGKVLRYLFEHAGRTIPREELLTGVWEYHKESRSFSIYTMMRRLRRKVELDSSDPRILQTVHGVGYRCELPHTAEGTNEHGLLGRDSQLETLQNGAGLVTVTGFVGVGKTALLRALASSRADGPTHFVDCSDLSSVPPLYDRLAAALDLTDSADPEAISNALGARRRRLFLDGVDNLIPEVSGIVAAWAQQHSDLTLFVGSRTRLGLKRELVVELESLDLETAAQMFVVVANRAGAQVEVDQVVMQLCDRVDCLPLSIELLASRAHAASPKALLDQVAQLPHGADVQAALRLSVDGLSDSGRSVLAQACVFAGSFSSEDAIAVIEVPSGTWIVDELKRLRDQSLLSRVTGWDGELRFHVFSLLREMVLRWADPVQLRETQKRLRRWIIDKCPLRPPGMLLSEAERDWLRSSGDLIAGALEGETGAEAAQLFVAFANAQATRRPTQITQAACDLLDSQLEPEHRLRVLGWLGHALEIQGDQSGAIRALEEARVLAEQTDSDAWLAWSHGKLAMLARWRGDSDGARQHGNTGVALCRKIGLSALESKLLAHLGSLERESGDFALGAEHLQLALALAEQNGDLSTQARIQGNLGNLQQQLGELDVARQSYQGAIDLARKAGDLYAEAALSGFLGILLRLQEDWEGAQAKLGRALGLHRQHGAKRQEAATLGDLGDLYLDRSELDAARQHLGAALQLFRQTNSPRGVGWTLISLARIYALRDNKPAATRCLVLAKTELRNASDRPGILFAELHELEIDQDREDYRSRLTELKSRAEALGVGQASAFGRVLERMTR